MYTITTTAAEAVEEELKAFRHICGINLFEEATTHIYTYWVARRASKGMKLEERKNNLTIVNIITRSSIHTSTISSLQYFLYNFKYIFHILASSSFLSFFCTRNGIYVKFIFLFSTNVPCSLARVRSSLSSSSSSVMFFFCISFFI